MFKVYFQDSIYRKLQPSPRRMQMRFPVHATGCSAHASSKGIRRRRKAKQAYYEELRELESSPDEEDVPDEEQHDGGAIYHPRFWVLYF